MKKFLLVLALVLMLAVAVPAPAHAQDGSLPIEAALNAVLVIVVGFAALRGTSQLNAAIVSLLKHIPGLVRDGTSSQWTAGLNLVFFVGLVAFGVFRPDVTLDVLDGYAGQIAQIAVFVLGFVVQMTGSKPAYEQLKAAGIPLVGKSFSK